jgi:hypothetical protein
MRWCLVDEGYWAEFMAAGDQYGFTPRRDDSLAFAQDTRGLLVHHQKSGIDVDMVFGSK